MKRIHLMSAGITLFFLGAVTPAYAQQNQHDQDSRAPKQEQQAKPEALQQQQEQTKPPKQQPKAQQEQIRANSKPPQQQVQRTKQPQPKSPAEQANVDDHQRQQAKNQQAIWSRQQPASPRIVRRTEEARTRQHAEPALRLSMMGSGRIPDERYRSNFGRTHEFRIGSPRMVDGYSRFQYGGYWFGFVQPWPDSWYYTDDVYVESIGGQYYLCNPYYPGVHIAISVVL